jgi:hypothetical protein
MQTTGAREMKKQIGFPGEKKRETPKDDPETLIHYDPQ